MSYFDEADSENREFFFIKNRFRELKNFKDFARTTFRERKHQAFSHFAKRSKIREIAKFTLAKFYSFKVVYIS